jgi:hypothetical protein
MDEYLLYLVLTDLGITTDDEDIIANIRGKVKAVKLFLMNAGAKIGEEITEDIVSCIAIGVNDLLNNKAGETKFSPAFNMIAMQICRG